jgi:hypothetical protein
MMNALVSTTALAVATPLMANDTDAELLNLCHEVLRINKLFDEAETAFDKVFELYIKREPARPVELKWHPLTALSGIGRISEETSPGKYRLWCDPEDIEEHRNKPFMKRQFIGTNEQWQSNSEAEHLWQMIPDEKEQERFAVILAAHDRYQAAIKAIKDELGYDVAERNADELHERGSKLVSKIIEMKAATIEGLRAKANVVLQWCWAGEIDSDWNTTDSKVMASMVRDLLAGARA